MSNAEPAESLADRRLIERALHDRLGGTWTASLAPNSWTPRSFIATDGDRRVFVKVDVRFDVLRRLAEIGVAPPLIDTAHHENQWMAIQEFVDGPRPERRWFRSNLPALAKLFAAYHHDRDLTVLLTPATGLSYRDVVTRTLAELARRAEAIPGDSGLVSRLPAAVAALTDESGGLQEAPLVPTHGDPNRRNFLLADGRPYLVDWDELALADPLRDIGQMLWWYVPQEAWAQFLAASDLDPTPELFQRLYWWIASEFLEVATTTAEAGLETDAHAFFGDFTAALEHRPNPRAG